ncbi:kinase-like domain-containing protein [Aspergillus avenaceus]|uniref:EKC/KEOPS complex subunit BUD32 n=1 Tax=Aspergillus avenaceus TaxID=36643 RepID=A0A5N6TV56_ASPAV|nr:kinase-like domain-containing protein [Aspergillus avenaceus]
MSCDNRTPLTTPNSCCNAFYNISKMLVLLWKCYSVVYAVLGSLFRGSLDLLSHLVPFSRKSLSIREEPDDLERYERPLSKNESPAVASNDALGLGQRNEVVLPGKSEKEDPVPYEPHYDDPLSQGSTSLIARMRPGVVVKCPRYSWWHSATATHPFVKDIKHNFEVEERLLNILGTHPRIIRYIGISEAPRGLLFEEASEGNLQAYIDQHNDTIDPSLRLKWCRQAAEAVQYIHQKGVIHSDLRPENFLLHSDSKGKLDLLLCDFGGSTCGEIDGGHLPDPGFFNPCKPWMSTEAVDIFSLGSVFYTIMTGHWPYKSPGPFESVAEKDDYEELVDALFASQKYPPVDDIPGGTVIYGCWTERYADVEALIRDQSLSFDRIAFQKSYGLT